MKEDEIDGACSTHGGDEECIRYFSRKTSQEKRPLSGRIWENNINIDLKGTVCKGLDSISLAQDTTQRRDLKKR